MTQVSKKFWSVFGDGVDEGLSTIGFGKAATGCGVEASWKLVDAWGPVHIVLSRETVSGEGVPNGELRPFFTGTGAMGLFPDPIFAAIVIGLRPTGVGEASMTLGKPLLVI